MQYLFRQTYNLNTSLNKAEVVLLEPELDLGRLYAKHLRDADYNVFQAMVSDLHQILAEVEPKALIYSSNLEPQTIIKHITSIRKLYPSLHIITLSNHNEPIDVASWMEAGISAHINKKLSRPQDIVVALDQIFSSN